MCPLLDKFLIYYPIYSVTLIGIVFGILAVAKKENISLQVASTQVHISKMLKN